MHPIVASLEISIVIEQSNDIKNIAAVEIGSQRLKIHVFGCVMMHVSLVVQYFQQLFSDFIMSATIKVIPHIADEAANTKKSVLLHADHHENYKKNSVTQRYDVLCCPGDQMCEGRYLIDIQICNI
ncbi:hypothetical protein T4A_6118 [Trichinella pseudospiralis]|uniref:Uncharacterized protein n=1 Tax=Trichinella pseudospiralis TaxID=6337 RepID=A0A0V1EU36_TRIPS|nr:hypothetical protein T4A_6118 [Trichinella pseudospiralis]